MGADSDAFGIVSPESAKNTSKSSSRVTAFGRAVTWDGATTLCEVPEKKNEANETSLEHTISSSLIGRE
jgi:hypothetical protein